MKHSVVLGIVAVLVASTASGQDAKKPATPDAGPGIHQRSITVDGMERVYLLNIPKKPSKSAPLLLVLHGGGGTAQGMTKMGIQEKAGPLGFIVAFPQGYKNSWNAGPGLDNHSPNWGPAFQKGVNDVAFLKALIEDVANKCKIDRKRIYATGWSNGSAMSFRLAMEHPELIAAVAGVESEISLFNPKPPKRPVPMMYFWGTLDPIKRPGAPDAATRAARHLENWMRLNNTSMEGTPVKKVGSAEFTAYKGGSKGADVIVWKVVGMGHQWPGLVPANAKNKERLERALGPLNTDISANTEMLDFFLKHPLP